MCLALLCFTGVGFLFFFLQIEGKALHSSNHHWLSPESLSPQTWFSPDLLLPQICFLPSGTLAFTPDSLLLQIHFPPRLAFPNSLPCIHSSHPWEANLNVLEVCLWESTLCQLVCLVAAAHLAWRWLLVSGENNSKYLTLSSVPVV